MRDPRARHGRRAPPAKTMARVVRRVQTDRRHPILDSPDEGGRGQARSDELLLLGRERKLVPRRAKRGRDREGVLHERLVGAQVIAAKRQDSAHSPFVLIRLGVEDPQLKGPFHGGDVPPFQPEKLPLSEKTPESKHEEAPVAFVRDIRAHSRLDCKKKFDENSEFRFREMTDLLLDSSHHLLDQIKGAQVYRAKSVVHNGCLHTVEVRIHGAVREAPQREKSQEQGNGVHQLVD